MRRVTLCGSVVVPFILSGLALSACGDRDKDGRDTAATDATADTTGDDLAGDTTVATETTVASDTPDEDTSGADADTGVPACSAANLAGCLYPSRGVEYDVREGIATVETATGRSLPLLARVPRVAGPVPVVIWMHGGGANDAGHRESEVWGDMLARHGYLVIHVATSSFSGAQGLTLCALAAVPEAECTTGDDEDGNGLVAVFRSFDLTAVLDDLPRLSTISVNNGGPAFDLDKVAVSGWSGGSRAPQLIMGAKVRPTAGAPLFTKPHSRAAAAFLMSTAGPGFGGFFDEGGVTSVDDMRGPTFTATGQNDQKPTKPDLTGLVRRALFDDQPADGERWLLYSNLAVGVGAHGTYNLADLDSNDERLERLSNAIASVTRAFLDAKLRGNADAQTWLDSQNAKTLAGDVDWLNQ